jgi:hypothetical protein
MSRCHVVTLSLMLSLRLARDSGHGRYRGAVVVLRGTVIARIIDRTDFLRALSVALGPRHR